MVRKLQRMRWSMSLFVMCFGTRRRYEDLAHHTILLGARYRELIDEIFHGKRIPDDFSLYLHAPTRSDPSLAPPGCEAFYVLAPVPHLGQVAVDWQALAPRYGDRLLEVLEQRLLPGLRDALAVRHDITPADFASRYASYLGSAFSVAPLLTQSAWFRPHNRDPRIPGLYIVGAGTHPGAGVPGVINSAKATAALIARDFGLIS
jgi:phytoene desaturase